MRKNNTKLPYPYAEKISKSVDGMRKKDERLFQGSVWVLVCPLTFHFNSKKTKLGQHKTLCEMTI